MPWRRLSGGRSDFRSTRGRPRVFDLREEWYTGIMLTVSNLAKRFWSVTAVSGVTFEIKSGEIFSLIGPNGSGKTTIVKTIAGLLCPDGGAISIGGYDTSAHPLEAKARVGYIPDDPVVWPSMTGREFLHFVGALFGVRESVRTRRIPNLLRTFGLSGIEDNSFEDYSRGNKQKFSILAALLHEPKLLLVDEPIVGLDPGSAIIARNLFREFADGGGAVLLVTHTLSVAEEISDRIGVLREGALRAAGTLAQLRKKSKAGARAPLEKIYMAFTA